MCAWRTLEAEFEQFVEGVSDSVGDCWALAPWEHAQVRIPPHDGKSWVWDATVLCAEDGRPLPLSKETAVRDGQRLPQSNHMPAMAVSGCCREVISAAAT